ncbi:hypothetical protein HRI_003128600 [Hibiscus trionum]|uniref:Uncharacterized protein n=1 Tax=Hibiscus trionum TaxID=183268 RepID=A0A9W7MAT7_HIBTR|nr:hypothetical protein HRI_003128600 [Hibiscus trionum]
MLMTQRHILHAHNLCFPNPERISKVRKSMCLIKQVLTDRAIEDPNSRRSTAMKRMIMLCDIDCNISLFNQTS